MKKLGIIILAVMLVGFVASPSSATLIDLFDWAFNVDGVTVDSLTLSAGAGYYTPLPGDLPPNINVAGFTFSNGPGSGGGLGAILVTVTGAGDHFVGAFFDHEIDEAVNTYFNESGAVNGAPAAGQSWEIDDPAFGDIFVNLENSDNVAGSMLDNMNQAPGDPMNPFVDDVSMAMGWDFNLAGGETVLIRFDLSKTEPAGFHLAQTDPDSAVPGVDDATIYFSSSSDIPDMPEPATMLMLGTGLVALAGFARKRFKES